MAIYIDALMLVAAFGGLAIYIRTRPRLPELPWLLGPLILDILTGIYTLGVSPYTRPGDNWPFVPVLVTLAAVLIWHIGLVVQGPGRAALVAYGAAHMAFWMQLALICMLRISKDSL